MISSPSAQIEAAGGNHMKTTIIKDGKRTVVPDYARVQGILIGVVAAYILVLTIIGPECVLLQGVHQSQLTCDIGTTDPTLRNTALPFRRARPIVPLMISAV